VQQLAIPIQPKSMHDETNATDYDEFGRMQANLGVELFPATPGAGAAVLYQYGNPSTEIFDGTNMPTADMKVRPISTTTDGTQIWKITHNGVDTHPIHFHAFDVQLISRVTWDNIILAPDENELGWKETIRVSPLEDTYIAIRPVLPKLPWELPNSVRLVDPLRPNSATLISNTIAATMGITTSFMSPNGNPIDLINHYINFGAEYLWHCHILSHEEMDMMRPMSIAYAPVKPALIQATKLTPTSTTVTLTWTDSSIAETSYVIQRRVLGSSVWTTLSTVTRPLDSTYVNKVEVMTFSNTKVPLNTEFQYRVIAQNTVGDLWKYTRNGANGFPSVTAKSYSGISDVLVAPSNLGIPAFGRQNQGLLNRLYYVKLSWIDNATNELGFQVERTADNGVTWAVIGGRPTMPGSGGVPAFTDYPASGTYSYRVAAIGAGGLSAYTNIKTVILP
jgi:hypothetical protein